MSRPAHIAPLDAALDARIEEYHEGTRELREQLTANLDEMDRLERELGALKAGVVAAERKRREAWYGAQKIEETIRKLGYVVLGPEGKGTVGPEETRLEGLTFGPRDVEDISAQVRLTWGPAEVDS